MYILLGRVRFSITILHLFLLFFRCDAESDGNLVKEKCGPKSTKDFKCSDAAGEMHWQDPEAYCGGAQCDLTKDKKYCCFTKVSILEYAHTIVVRIMDETNRNCIGALQKSNNNPTFPVNFDFVYHHNGETKRGTTDRFAPRVIEWNLKPKNGEVVENYDGIFKFTLPWRHDNNKNFAWACAPEGSDGEYVYYDDGQYGNSGYPEFDTERYEDYEHVQARCGSPIQRDFGCVNFDKFQVQHLYCKGAICSTDAISQGSGTLDKELCCKKRCHHGMCNNSKTLINYDHYCDDDCDSSSDGSKATTEDKARCCLERGFAQINQRKDLIIQLQSDLGKRCLVGQTSETGGSMPRDMDVYYESGSDIVSGVSNSNNNNVTWDSNPLTATFEISYSLQIDSNRTLHKWQLPYASDKPNIAWACGTEGLTTGDTRNPITGHGTDVSSRGIITDSDFYYTEKCKDFPALVCPIGYSWRLDDNELLCLQQPCDDNDEVCCVPLGHCYWDIKSCNVTDEVWKGDDKDLLCEGEFCKDNEIACCIVPSKCADDVQRCQENYAWDTWTADKLCVQHPCFEEDDNCCVERQLCELVDVQNKGCTGGITWKIENEIRCSKDVCESNDENCCRTEGLCSEKTDQTCMPPLKWKTSDSSLKCADIFCVHDEPNCCVDPAACSTGVKNCPAGKVWKLDETFFCREDVCQDDDECCDDPVACTRKTFDRTMDETLICDVQQFWNVTGDLNCTHNPCIPKDPGCCHDRDLCANYLADPLGCDGDFYWETSVADLYCETDHCEDNEPSCCLDKPIQYCYLDVKECHPHEFWNIDDQTLRCSRWYCENHELHCCQDKSPQSCADASGLGCMPNFEWIYNPDILCASWRCVSKENECCHPIRGLCFENNIEPVQQRESCPYGKYWKTDNVTRNCDEQFCYNDDESCCVYRPSVDKCRPNFSKYTALCAELPEGECTSINSKCTWMEVIIEDFNELGFCTTSDDKPDSRAGCLSLISEKQCRGEPDCFWECNNHCNLPCPFGFFMTRPCTCTPNKYKTNKCTCNEYINIDGMCVQTLDKQLEHNQKVYEGKEPVNPGVYVAIILVLLLILLAVLFLFFKSKGLTTKSEVKQFFKSKGLKTKSEVSNPSITKRESVQSLNTKGTKPTLVASEESEKGGKIAGKTKVKGVHGPSTPKGEPKGDPKGDKSSNDASKKGGVVVPKEKSSASKGKGFGGKKSEGSKRPAE